MKKQRFSVFIVLTLIFFAFTLGFFLGSTRNRGEVRLSVPDSMQALPTSTLPTTIPTETSFPVLFPIDPNIATKEELMALPGIGEVYAQRIISYRESNGFFSCAEDLMNVDGIGEKRLEEIRSYITIGG